ncbi:MAG: DUF3631 domain-containing protein [Desulfobulbus sp.]|nr:DUF3631 domain-containing protein [Desulfobulbus sp.]
MTDIVATIQRFIICSTEVAHAVALWSAMTWFMDVVQVAPLAIITAPEKRCGKSQLLFLLGRLTARSITASSISPAALYRAIDAWQPTLLIDEADAFLKDNEELRGIINSGHTRDAAYVIRTVDDNFTPTKFNTWGAKAIAGIGHVAETIMDRSVILELRRKLPHEEAARLRSAEANFFSDLRAKLVRFADDYAVTVRQARPPLPSGLNDRAQDNWDPLLAIAMVAGGHWLEIGTRVAIKLSGCESAAQAIGVELLSDIKEIFEIKEVERISTVDLIRALCDDEHHPEWEHPQMALIFSLTFSCAPDLTEKQVDRLKDLLACNLTTVRAYLLKEDFQRFWRYSSPTWAGKFLDACCTRTMRSKIKPMKKVAKMLRAHRPLPAQLVSCKKYDCPGLCGGL